MTFTEGFLIAVILVLTYQLWTNRPAAQEKVFDCVDRASGELTTVKMNYTPEQKAMAENIESFSGGSADCSGDLAYAVDEFGAPGMEYKDWVASQSVGTDVLINHATFVKDRIKSTGQNITGRTYSPDSHDSYDPIPWIGLRRPQAVPVDNPTQVPDVDKSLYSAKSSLRWGF